MDWLLRTAGAALVLLALTDVFQTVLVARSGTSILSERVGSVTWRAFCRIGGSRRFRGSLLSYCGPATVVLIIVMWVCLLVVGFALVVWPSLATSFRSGSEAVQSDFATALYLAGGSLTSAGAGAVTPVTPVFKVMSVIESAIGLSVITLTLTYLLQVYTALQRRNHLALSLHEGTSRTGDAAELMAGLCPSGEFAGTVEELDRLAERLLDLYESHHFYPSLLWFHFRRPHYGLSRVLLISMDLATLVRAAPGEEGYARLKRAAAVTKLWGGGMRLLTELSRTVRDRSLGRGSQGAVAPDAGTAERWRRRYFAAWARLRQAGIQTAGDERAGAEDYVALRGEWDRYIKIFAGYSGRPAGDVDPTAAVPDEVAVPAPA